jgi:hypothetical protein
MPPPSAAMRSIDRSEIVSAWSMNQCRSPIGMSWFTRSNTSSALLIVSS